MSEKKKTFVVKIKDWYAHVTHKDDPHYISGKESRKITRENFRITRAFEKKKKRKNVPESEYTAAMRDENNILEIENLHTYFYTDAGVSKAVNGVSFDIRRAPSWASSANPAAARA